MKPSRGVDLAVMRGCLCTELRRASRLVTQHYDAALRAHRLRATQLPLLVAAEVAGTITIAALGARLGMERTTVLRNLRPLARRGLVRIQMSSDSRRSEVRLTGAGRRLLERAYPSWEQAQRTITDALRDPAWKQLLGRLARETARVPA